MKLLNNPKIKQFPKWLAVSFCTGVGGLATLILSSNNAAAVLAVTTASAGAGVAIFSEQEKKLAGDERLLATNTELIENPKNLKILPSAQETKLEPVENKLNLFTYLENKNIKLESHRLPQEIDASSDRIAYFIGSKYSSVKNFYKAIKRNLSTGKKFAFRLADSSQQEIANCTQLAELLYRSSFLSHYRYLRSEKLISVSTQSRGDMINFLTGEWFERYVLQEVNRLLAKNQLNYEYLLNSKVRFVNGDSFELDLLYFVNQQLLWIECKTKSDISDSLARYSKHKKVLAIPENRAFVVALDIPESQAQELTQRWQITVVNQNNFLDKISQALGLKIEE